MLNKLTGPDYINYVDKNRIIDTLIQEYSFFMDDMKYGSASDIKATAHVFYSTVINAYENYDIETKWLQAAYKYNCKKT